MVVALVLVRLIDACLDSPGRVSLAEHTPADPGSWLSLLKLVSVGDVSFSWPASHGFTGVAWVVASTFPSTGVVEFDLASSIASLLPGLSCWLCLEIPGGEGMVLGVVSPLPGNELNELPGVDIADIGLVP